MVFSFQASLSILSFVLFLFCVILTEIGCSLECDNPLQYSYLKNPMDRRTWQAPWGLRESDMTEHACTKLNEITIKQKSYIPQQLSNLDSSTIK